MSITNSHHLHSHEIDYVDVNELKRNPIMSEKNPLENEDPIWQTRMQMLMKRKKNMEIEQTIDDALYQYYTVERGGEGSQLEIHKGPEWWIDYLISLGMDPRNP